MKLNISLRRHFCRFWRDFFTTDASERRIGKRHGRRAIAAFNERKAACRAVDYKKAKNS